MEELGGMMEDPFLQERQEVRSIQEKGSLIAFGIGVTSRHSIGTCHGRRTHLIRTRISTPTRPQAVERYSREESRKQKAESRKQRSVEAKILIAASLSYPSSTSSPRTPSLSFSLSLSFPLFFCHFIPLSLDVITHPVQPQTFLPSSPVIHRQAGKQPIHSLFPPHIPVTRTNQPINNFSNDVCISMQLGLSLHITIRSSKSTTELLKQAAPFWSSNSQLITLRSNLISLILDPWHPIATYHVAAPKVSWQPGDGGKVEGIR
jgi:hypothetical protein